MRTLKNTQHVVGAAPTSGAEIEHQEETNLEEGPPGPRSRALWGGCSHGLLDGGKLAGVQQAGAGKQGPTLWGYRWKPLASCPLLPARLAGCCKEAVLWGSGGTL